MRTHVITALLASLLAAPAGAAPQLLPLLADGTFAPWKGPHVPGEVLVKFKAEAAPAARASAVRARAHAVLGEVEATPWVHVKTAPGESVEAALAAYAANPDVEWAQPNYRYRIARLPANEPNFGFLWAFRNTGQDLTGAPTQPGGGGLPYGSNPGTNGADMALEPAWNVTTDCSGVVVAVADTGINYTHADLATNMWDGGPSFPNHGRNFVVTTAGDSATMDLNGHGTHVAGTIGARDGNGGVVGVCWKASLMAIRVLDAGGSGTSASIIAGVSWASTHGAKVINMSLGGSGAFDQAYSDAITTAQNNDVVVVVAAGNGGADGQSDNNDAVGQAVYPCNFTQPNLVCVAALDQQYNLSSFSNYGTTSVDVGAPGTNIVSTWPGEAIRIPVDDVNDVWNSNGPGWAYGTLPITGNPPALVIPFGFPNAPYPNDADARAWTSVTLPAGLLAATLNLTGALVLSDTDVLRVGWAGGTAGDPFAVTHHQIEFNAQDNTVEGSNILIGSMGLDISSCGAGTCAVGFQLVSNASGAANGVAIVDLSVAVIENGSTSYNTEDGTSMASPNAAGVATLLRAYNPSFTYADTVAALKAGGRSVAALAGQTTTGRAVDAMGSLRFVNPPRNVTATGAVVTP